MKKKAIIISIKGTTLTKKEKILLSREKPWGLILFKRNIKSFKQIKSLIKDVKRLVKDSKFPIHDDTPNKLLSGVIYLSPEENKGTYFYNDKKGSGKTYADWKPNKGVFFSRAEKETWHSFGADGINHRTVLVFNLNTSNKNLRRIYKIENKSYLLGMFRYKINPTLHRLFNFTI